MSRYASRASPSLPALVLLGVLAAVTIATILSTPWIFTNDGAQHVHSAELERTWGDAPSVEGLLTRGHAPTSNGFSALYRLFALGLGWSGAAHAVLALLALAWIGGFAALVYAIRPERLHVATLGAASALGWCFYMGFFNFLAGSSIGLLALALSLRTGVRRPAHVVALALALGIGVWVHLFAAALTGLALVILAIASAREGRGRRVGLTLLAGAPAAVYATGIALSFQSIGGVMEVDWQPSALLDAKAFFVGGPWWRSVPVLLVAGVGLATAALRWRRGALTAAERGLLVTSLVFLVLAGAAPFHLPRWQYFSPRFLPLGILAAMALVPVEGLRGRVSRVAVPAIFVVISLSSLGWSLGFHQRTEASCRPIVDALDAPLAREGLRVALVLEECDGALTPDLDGEIRYLQPLMHLDALMAAAQGGVAAGLWSTRPTIHPFRFRDDIRSTLPTTGPAVQLRRARAAAKSETEPGLGAFTDSVLSWYGVRAADAADLILWSRRDRDWFVARGFVLDHGDGPLSILHYEGCPLALGLDGIPANAVEAVIEHGWYPLETTHRSVTVSLLGDASGRRILALDGPPCGPLWIRARIRTEDGTDRLCAGADPTGRVVMRNAPGRRGVVCSLVPATPSAAPGSSR